MITNTTSLDVDAWLKCGTIMHSGAGSVVLAWGSRRWQKTCDSESSRPSFYFPDFSLEDKEPWFVQPYTTELTLKELQTVLSSTFDFSILKQKESSLSWTNPYLQTFSQAFCDLQEQIQAGNLAKAVPYVFEFSKGSMKHEQFLFSLATLLLYADKNPVYIYGFWEEDEGILGATPEVLFQLSNAQKISTMACAGTAARDQSSEKLQADSVFMRDPKETHEHRLVVKGIQESLITYGTVSIGNMQLVKLSTLSHLVTPIDVTLHKPLDFEQIVHILHPTPALGAFPRNAGIKWLKKYQQLVERHRFGAPAGYFLPSQKNGFCYVAIRNVQWDKESMRIGAGCGVVASSKCKKEWNEINLKLAMIKGMLAL